MVVQWSNIQLIEFIEAICNFRFKRGLPALNDSYTTELDKATHFFFNKEFDGLKHCIVNGFKYALMASMLEMTRFAM